MNHVLYKEAWHRGTQMRSVRPFGLFGRTRGEWRLHLYGYGRHWYSPPRHPADVIIVWQLSTRRGWGLDAQKTFDRSVWRRCSTETLQLIINKVLHCKLLSAGSVFLGCFFLINKSMLSNPTHTKINTPNKEANIINGCRPCGRRCKALCIT